MGGRPAFNVECTDLCRDDLVQAGACAIVARGPPFSFPHLAIDGQITQFFRGSSLCAVPDRLHEGGHGDVNLLGDWPIVCRHAAEHRQPHVELFDRGRTVGPIDPSTGSLVPANVAIKRPRLRSGDGGREQPPSENPLAPPDT